MTKGNWDVYIAFFERGFELLSPHGHLVFITPDKWISKPFGDELRRQKIGRLAEVVRLGRGVFANAKVDAIVTIFANAGASEIRVCEYAKETVLPIRTV